MIDTIDMIDMIDIMNNSDDWSQKPAEFESSCGLNLSEAILIYGIVIRIHM
jgi:hypothetical protein